MGESYGINTFLFINQLRFSGGVFAPTLTKRILDGQKEFKINLEVRNTRRIFPSAFCEQLAEGMSVNLVFIFYPIFVD
jgi:hypothetical protein